jgi:cell division protein FtsB
LIMSLSFGTTAYFLFFLYQRLRLLCFHKYLYEREMEYLAKARLPLQL